MPDRPSRLTFIKWDAHVCAPFDKVDEESRTPALAQFVDDIARVVRTGGTVLTSVPLSEPGSAAIVALVYDE